MIIGGQMILSSLSKNEQEHIFRPVGIGLFIFALSVSLDSFSVGLSLGIFGAKGLFAILLFGMTAMVLTWAGFLIGQKTHVLLGRSSEILGGCILIGMGIKLLCSMH